MFNAFDAYGRGYITREDIKKALSHVMAELPQQQKQKVINTLK